MARSWVPLGCALSLLGAAACRERPSAWSDLDPRALSSCDVPASHRSSRPLDPPTFEAALRALRPYVPEGTSLLEVRAHPERVAIQVRVPNTSTIAEYAYDGRVIGPAPAELAGEGELGPNLFDVESVDWSALSGLFGRAKDAVDPADGRVTELLVRRHLPFSRDVRARFFVASPRMSGHFDADAKGRPLGP